MAEPPRNSMTLPLTLGPRDDWFTDEALARLSRHEFTVTSDADRVGIRLDGPELPRRRNGELPSEGVVLGALQVPTKGRPTLFLADRPVTGGYPVVGVVPGPGVNAAAQAVPGTRIRFALRRPQLNVNQ
jgi:allophanate hydrolase subunit 2